MTKQNEKQVELTETQKVLAEMLQENTGRHMLDSGGTGGRHWERNAGRDFLSEPSSVVSGGYGSLEVTHNVFHWLVERVEYDQALQTVFDLFVQHHCGEGLSWFECMAAWSEGTELFDWLSEVLLDPSEDGEDMDLDEVDEPHQGSILAGQAPEVFEMALGLWRGLERTGGEWAGIYGEGDPVTHNTYNAPDLLSQTLQFTYCTCDHVDMALIQVHGGADVRGGYTKPRAFTKAGYFDGLESLFDGARARLDVDQEVFDLWATANPNHDVAFGEAPSWYTDDAYTWYTDNPTLDQLEDFETSEDEADRGQGKIFVDEEGRPHCPYTGLVLVSSF